MTFTILLMTVQFRWMVIWRLETIRTTPITNPSWVPLRQYLWEIFLRLVVVARHLYWSNLQLQLMQIQDLPIKTPNRLQSMLLRSLWIQLFRLGQRDHSSSSTSTTRISSSHTCHHHLHLILNLMLFWILLGTTPNITILPCGSLQSMLPS